MSASRVLRLTVLGPLHSIDGGLTIVSFVVEAFLPAKATSLPAGNARLDMPLCGGDKTVQRKLVLLYAHPFQASALLTLLYRLPQNLHGLTRQSGIVGAMALAERLRC